MAALAWAGITHVGKVRSTNEDQFVADLPVFLVADGMGGHECGDVASALVADAFQSLVGRDIVAIDDVEQTVIDANFAVRRAAASRRSERAMGTTLVALVLVGGQGIERWVAVNVGDSRLYRFSAGVLVQITTDHSVVQEMVAAGSITESEARTHPERNVVTRAMGISEGIVADFALLDVRDGDRFLLCSDGVYGELADEQLRVLLARTGGPAQAAQVVVDAVLRSEARDNLTVVVVDVLESGRSSGEMGEANEDTSPIANEAELSPDSKPQDADILPVAATADIEELPVVAIMAVPSAVRGEPDELPADDEEAVDPAHDRVIEVPEW